MEVSLPEVLAKVCEQFARHEKALASYDVAVRDELFWRSPHTLRYGLGENLHGFDANAAFRSQRANWPGTRSAAHRHHHVRD